MRDERDISYPRFSDAEYQRRYEAIRRAMEKRELDCLIVFGDSGHSRFNMSNVHYLSNYVDQMWAYVVFPLGQEPTLFTTLYSHVINAKLISVIKDVRYGGPCPVQEVVSRIKELKLDKGRIGLVGVHSYRKISLPQEHFEILRQEFPNAHFEHATELIENVRIIKSAEEIDVLEKAAHYSDIAMEALVQKCKPGVTDHELQASIMCSYLADGGIYHFQLIGSTPMANPIMPYPWPFPGNRTLKKGDVVMTEISAGFNYYSGQVIRTIFVQAEPLPIYRELFKVAKEAHDNVAAALIPGNTEKDAIEAGMVILNAGYRHHASLVHGWGQNHEPPFIGLPGWPVRVTPITFQPGMVLMIEPNPVTQDERFGVFLGNLHVVTESGSRNLHAYPNELVVA